MKKLKKEIVKALKEKRDNLHYPMLVNGYSKAIDDVIELLSEFALATTGISKPSSLDLILDLDIIEDNNYNTISKEDAVKLFYYKLGWDRGEHRVEQESALSLAKIV